MFERSAIIAEAVRTPFGAYFGALSGVRPDDMLAFTISELLKKIPQLNPAEIDDVYIGDANGAGEDNRNVARMGVLLAGLPVSVPGTTINRLCGSGGEAVVQASRAIRTGDCEFVIAGGVESMSRAPWIVQREAKKKPETLDDREWHQSTVGWRMTNPKFPEEWTQSLGRCSEEVAQRYKISRQAMDEWSHRSHLRAAAAWDKKLHDGFVSPFNGLAIDESIRRNSSIESLAALPSAFSEGGEGTAGNSSPINDGAVVMLLTDETHLTELGIKGIGRIVATQVVATKPNEFSRAPALAITKVLAKANRKVSDISLWEINEAFASMVLTVLHEMPGIDPELVNVNGGSIAIGHPVGASAARVIVDCARELKRRGGGLGVMAACIGVGLGIAIVIEVN